MVILNHIVYKVCIPTLPFGTLAKMKNLDTNLKEFSSEAFFYFNKGKGEIDVSLGNPEYNYLNGVLNVEN